MTQQLELFQKKLDLGTENPLVLILVSERITGWISAREFHFQDRGKVFSDTDFESACRQLREWAQQSDGRIISGNQGYRLIDYATPEEREHAARRLISQGRKMHKRGIRILRINHQIQGGQNG